MLPHSADLLIMNIIAGLAGSILGLGVYYLLIIERAEASLFNAVATVFTIFGSLMAVGLLDAIHVVATKKGGNPSSSI
jgi:uncharacterized membrane protein YeaQ/YmgE (transglycosylase-associated protein family)